MGDMAQKIVKLDVSDLIKVLNEAYAEEWLAYYQYWIGAKVVCGQFKKGVEEEFLEHAKEELEHADMLANRILQLGGTPVINFDDLSKIAKCKYEAPINEDTHNLVVQNQKDNDRSVLGDNVNRSSRLELVKLFVYSSRISTSCIKCLDVDNINIFY